MAQETLTPSSENRRQRETRELLKAQNTARQELNQIERQSGEDFVQGSELSQAFPQLVKQQNGQLVIRPNGTIVDPESMYQFDENVGRNGRLIRVITQSQLETASELDSNRGLRIKGQLIAGGNRNQNKILSDNIIDANGQKISSNSTLVVITHEGARMLLPAGRNAGKVLKMVLTFSGVSTLASMAGSQLINKVSENAIGKRIARYHNNDPEAVRANLLLLNSLR